MVHIPFLSSAWDPNGTHCLITGGSQGLGMALGVALARRGAEVTLVARSETKLEKAAQAALDARKSPSQKISFYPADVSVFAGAREAIEWSAAAGQARTAHEASKPIGRVPDVVFACAGGAKPGFFIKQTEEDFRAGTKTNYETALATAHGAASVMVREGVQGKIVFVSSTLGFMGLVGYLQYQPNKFAIRGLAEGLRSEMQLYGISVHCYFPGTIYTPGYELENTTKPAITSEIEGAAGGLTPEQCADKLVKGIQSNHFFITSDFETELFRADTTGGSLPSNNWLWDRLLGSIGQIALPIWRRFIADRSIREYAKKHPEEVRRPSSEGESQHLKIFVLSLLHRLFVLFCLLLLPTVVSTFDSSSELQLLLGSNGSIGTRLASHLIRWDSLHFVGLGSPAAMPSPTTGKTNNAMGGYAHEHNLAFQPGIVYLLRAAGFSCLGQSWSAPLAITLTSVAAVLASSASSVLLYHLLLSLRVRPRMAYTAAVLSILSPSPSTLVTPTPEPFFGFLSLVSMCLLSTPIDSSTNRPLSDWAGPSTLRVIISSIFIALATAFRANGVMLVGHLWYVLLWLRPHTRWTAVLVLPIVTMIATAPFVLNQVWTWNRFCDGTDLARRWCGHSLPYSFIQSHYWGVGLFKYWEMAQLPNFLLAAPVLTAAFYLSFRYYTSSTPERILKQTFLGWWSNDVSDTPISSDPFSYDSTPQLLPHIHLSTATACLLLFASHVQIALRFATPAWICVWLAFAHLVMADDGEKVSKNGRLWLTWLVGWNALSIVLFSAFLPPA